MRYTRRRVASARLRFACLRVVRNSLYPAIRITLSVRFFVQFRRSLGAHGRPREIRRKLYRNISLLESCIIKKGGFVRFHRTLLQDHIFQWHLIAN